MKRYIIVSITVAQGNISGFNSRCYEDTKCYLIFYLFKLLNTWINTKDIVCNCWILI